MWHQQTTYRVLWCLCVFFFSAIQAMYVAPEDCQWSPVDIGVSLTCNVRTINGAFDSTNFSLIQPENTVSLTVRCENVLFESALVNNSFQHLRELQELNFEFCKLQETPLMAFNGLTELKNLTIRTHNRDWGEFSFRIVPGSLSKLQLLERLDLSHNNMASLTPSLLCSLKNLEFVNLTHNDFSEVVNVGFTGGESMSCPVHVKHLDLAHNRLKVLAERGFAELRQLRVLALRHNRISRAEELALAGLNKLQMLDLSNNQLVALPPQFLKPVEQLTELYLQNNSLSVLSPGLFSGLQQLLILDLSHNAISSQWLGPDTFADLIRVIIIDLSYNKLTHIDMASFRSQYSLQILHLQHNNIVSIAENAFSSLYNLHTLVLSHNSLTYIDSLTFNGLYILATLSLDNNELQAINPGAFKNCSNLQEINMNVNKLTQVPSALSSLKFLRSLDISSNLIGYIQNASYQGLRHLYSLRLSGNRIGNLSKGVFRDLPSVRILSLARNKIYAIEQGTFDDVPELHALRLDSNFISDINGLFSNLHDLLMLNISANKISWFDYALIPIGLQWLDVHDNLIETLGNYYELEGVLKLRTIDASFNKISEIEVSSLSNGIEIVFLNNNNIKSIQPFTFLGKQNLTRVDITNNYLESLEMNAFRLTEVPNRKPLPEFSVSENPYLCDCNMEWLQRIGSFDDSRQYPRMVDVEDIMCTLTLTRRKAVVPLIKAHSSQFLCRYKSHCFALCHCCEFDACDCEMVCPENCTCYYDQSWNTNIVDCSGKSHTLVPHKIPMDVTELYLDGSDIPVLSSHIFIGRKNMKILYLNSSNVNTINNRTFNGLRDLHVLNLQGNKLTILHGYEFERLFLLRELYLSHNHISVISNITFVPLKALEILYLDHNFLVEFQVWQLSINPQLQEIKLAFNPWACQCNFVENFGEFLHIRGDYVRDLYDIECFYNSTISFLLADFNMSSCTNYSVTTFVQRFTVEGLMPMLIVVSTLLVLLLFLVILAFVYRQEISVWLYAKYGIRIFHRGVIRGEEDKLFDSFVSYSKKDEAFVTQILAPELECGNPLYRLCLHYRDLPVGGYMSDAITEAMESSRRTILILSENFLKSEWCRYEFKAAHYEVLNSCRHRLIVIVLGRLSQRDLDPDIRIWLKSSTFLHWGEKLFWEKLKYAMPDVRHRKTERNRNDVSVAVHI